MGWLCGYTKSMQAGCLYTSSISAGCTVIRHLPGMVICRYASSIWADYVVISHLFGLVISLYVIYLGRLCHGVWLSLLHNFIQLSLNSGSARVQTLLGACRRFGEDL